MFCPNCGKEMNDGAEFCANCGYSKKNIKSTKMKKILANKIFISIFIVVIVITAFIVKKLLSGKSIHSVTQINEIKTVEEYKNLKNINELKTIKLGHYHENDADDFIYDVEWIVLSKKDNKALLLSKYVLDAKPYNNEYINVDWENCSLRKWLNTEFYRLLLNFPGMENIILETEVDKKNSNSIIGNINTDKIFILSRDEMNYYFKNNLTICETKGNNYYKKQQKYIENEYWARTPEYSDKYAYILGSYGEKRNVIDNSGVRPAMWVDLTWTDNSDTSVFDGWSGNYYYREGKKVKSDWVLYNNNWYYLNENGKYIRGRWYKIGNEYYYFDSNGAMKNNTWINNEYFLGQDGKMLKNTITPDGYYVGSDGKYVNNENKLSDEVKLNYDWLDNATKKETQSNNYDSELVNIYNKANIPFEGFAKFDKDGKLWVHDNLAGMSEQYKTGKNANVYKIYTSKDIFDTYKHSFVMVGKKSEDAHDEYYKNDKSISASEYSSIEKKFNDMKDMYETLYKK